MDFLKNLPLDKYLNTASKYADENMNVVVGASALAALVLGGFVVLRKSDYQRNGLDYDATTGGLKLLNSSDHTLKKSQFKHVINDYETMFDGARKETGAITDESSIAVRKERYATMIDHFYNIVTDFYEYGWGQSFHFAPRWKNETFTESIKRAEFFLAARLGLKAGMKCLDLGCGVGGPARNIALFSGAEITGITINEYQVNIGNKYNENLGLGDVCRAIRGDFQNLPWPENTFDGCYEIEATCHSPDRIQTFTGVFKVLKPGAYFTGYEWVMTDNYDPKNPEHVRIKEGIEVGNALPTLVHYMEIIQCLKASGFEIIEYFDANRGVHSPNQIPWYEPLNGKLTLAGFRMTHFGRLCTHSMVWFLETIRIAPRGSVKISALLNATALDLVAGGQQEIFTPSFYFLARKPLN